MAIEELQDKTDEQLMELVKTENLKSAYDVLVLRHYQDAIRYCQSIIHEESMSYDIVQDSFADIYVQRSRYCAIAFRPYMLAVVRHKALDYLRKTGRSHTTSLEMDTRLPNQESSPEDMWIKHEEYGLLAKWIEELPDNYRDALYLYSVEGLSYREIADTMKKSVPQVKIFIYRARKKLNQRRSEEI